MYFKPGAIMNYATTENSIIEELQNFNSHRLDDLSNAQLMDRVDTKFVTTTQELTRLLPKLKGLCTILEVDGRRISKYENLYFDNEALRFYNEHHNGKLNRYKVRKRTYSEQAKSFLEVKFKNNKERTVKSRTPTYIEDINDNEKAFIHSLGLKEQNLVSRQDCNYSRIAFANEKTAERLTIDFNIRYRDRKTQKYISLNQLIILELKQAKLNYNSAIYLMLKKQNLKPSSFSKYCIGMSLLNHSTLKFNRFKPSILNVSKLSGVSVL